MKRLIYLVLFSLICLNSYAQKEATWWYFGSTAGLSFTGTGGAPVAQTNGKMNNLEGVASISNSKGGLLFYTDGEFVYNKVHAQMTNGSGLKGHNSSTQSAVIVQQPVRSNRYYIFTVDEEWKANGFQYSIVDTSLNGGNGQVISKNNVLLTKCAEKVGAVKHANKVDTWVVAHTADDNKFYVYKLNSQGISSPLVSSVGPVWASTGTGAKGYSKGYLKFSPDGTKLVAAIAGNQSAGGGGYTGNAGRIEIYDFDNLTGAISNPQIIDKNNISTATGIDAISGVYGVEFSPNGRFLYTDFYLPKANFGGDGNNGIWQFDLYLKTANAMGANVVRVAPITGSSYGGMQLGPDGKIYVARGRRSSISSITKPNCQGTACTFVDVALSLGKNSQWGIPTFISTFFNKAEFDWGSNAANLCENALTKLYILDSTGIDSVKWNFNDPSTGSLNTAKGFTVFHKFSSPATYNVFAQFYRKVTSPDCYADTARKKLTIFPNPKPKIGNDTVICEDAEVVMDATTPNATYLWSNGFTTPVNLDSTKGWHWVDVKVGGCTGRDSLYIDVIQYPKFSLGNDTLMCQYDSVKLVAAGGQKYLWSLGDTTASVFANDSGLVWAKASNGSCATTDTIHIKTRSIPTLNLGRDSILCQGDSITLLAKTSTSKLYLWSDLSQDSFLQVKSTGLYWARIKDTMCLSLRDSIKITFQSKVPFSLGKDTSFCQGGSFLLVANLSGAKTWEWKDNSTASTYSAKNAGTQWVTVSNGTCVYSDTINLATYSIPSFSLGKDTILCKGATLNPISSAFPNTEYTWMGTSKGFNYSITTAGKYYVDLVDLPKKVCKTSDTINVTFQNPVKINLGKDTTLCLGQTIDLTVAQYGFKSFKWWDGNVNASTRKNNPALNSPAPHWVEGNTGVCISRDSIFIDYFLPLTINLGPDIDLCDNATKDFDITDPNASQYQWLTMTGTTLATSPKYTATDPGGFYIGMVSNGSCSKKDTVEVTYFTTPIVDLGPDIDICDDEPISLLDASTSGAASYLWVTGETTPVIAPSQKSKFEYWVKATNGICSASDSVWVYFTSSPELSFGFEDSVFCDAPNLSYDFTLPNTTFRWMDGFDQPIRKIKVSGEYWVVAENNCNSDSAYVSIKIDETGCRLYFPTGFSPNTDGRNDVWRPVGQVIEWVDLIVYNRWGEIIYKGNPSLGWNGTVNGVPVPDGLYPVSVSYRKSTNGYPRLYVKTIVLTVIK